MRSFFTVTSAAANKNFTTLDRVKSDIGITTSTDDDWLTSQIEIMSADLCGYLQLNEAQDGSVTIARETLELTVRLEDDYAEQLFLPRLPVVSISSVVENGRTLDPTEYEFDANSGLLYRLCNDRTSQWFGPKVVVTQTAGWLMPDDIGRNFPVELEDACSFLVKASRFDRTRDPALRGENILNGLYAYTLFDPANADAIASQVASKIDRYRMPHAA